MKFTAQNRRLPRRVCALAMTFVLLLGAVTFAFAGGVMGTPDGEWNNNLIHRVNLGVSPTNFTFYLTEEREQFSFEILFSAQKSEADFYGKILTATLSGLDYDYLSWTPSGIASTPYSPKNAVLPVEDGVARTWSWYASYTFTADKAEIYNLSFDIRFVSGKNLENAEEHLLSVPITVSVVDKRGLRPAITEAEKITSFEYYTDASVARYNAALASARALLEDTAVVSQVQLDAAISELNASVSSLTYKSADYTALDAALKRVPSDLSDYSPASAKRVTDAVNAVDRTKRIFEQDSVNAMTQEINAAVDALVVQNFRLILPEDGSYTLNEKSGYITDIPDDAAELTGLTANFGDVSVTPSANGIGTGTAINIVYKGAVVKTVYVSIPGDIDGDGDADNADFLMIMNASVGIIELSSAQAAAADLNGDGAVDAIDAATHQLTYPS
ncbi:MAG: hypothetical protein GX051_10265 [Clostridiales bacterium]|nr:hypothetical protein [Clostridiales bacterium]